MVSPTSPLTLPNTDPTKVRPTQQPTIGVPNSYAALPNSAAGQGVRPRGERIEGIAQTVIMVAIGVAAGAASFTHVHDVAAAHGQPGWLAWADALILEAASVAAGFEIRRGKRKGKPVKFATCVLVCAVVLSLSAQVVHAEPSVIGWIAAALPALGFLAMVKMAMARADSTPAAGPVTTATSVAFSGPDADKQPLVPDTTSPVPVTTGFVPDPAGLVPDRQDQTGTGRDRKAAAPDVSGLAPAARKAAQTLAAQGAVLNRTSLAAQLRKEGHQLSTAAATALVRLLRAEAAGGVPTPADDAT